MNLFVSDPCPLLSARALDDRRLVKGVLEAAQLLSTVLGGPYRPTHRRHPVTLWVAADDAHAGWTFAHFLALAEEYSRRFRRRHACSLHAPFFQSRLADANAVPAVFANSARNAGLGLDFTDQPPPASDRAYLQARWRLDAARGRPPAWTGTTPPDWAAALKVCPDERERIL